MNIEDYLKKYGITKRGFARRLGITESALHKIIAGINSPRTTTAQKIGRLCKEQTLIALVPLAIAGRTKKK